MSQNQAQESAPTGERATSSSQAVPMAPMAVMDPDGALARAANFRVPNHQEVNMQGAHHQEARPQTTNHDQTASQSAGPTETLPLRLRLERSRNSALGQQQEVIDRLEKEVKTLKDYYQQALQERDDVKDDNMKLARFNESLRQDNHRLSNRVQAVIAKYSDLRGRTKRIMGNLRRELAGMVEEIDLEDDLLPREIPEEDAEHPAAQ